MKIVIPINLVPDLVEELEIDESGTHLDLTWARMILNEFDDHAIEQGILLKERNGGHVTVLAPDIEGADDALFTAGAKGADRLIKLTGDFEDLNSHALSRALFAVMKDLDIDLVLTGVQAHCDIDGQLGPLLAEYLGFPYVGYIAGVSQQNGGVMALKEFPGGLVAETGVKLPAVLGIQAADEPPRYVAFSKIRNAMNELSIEEFSAPALDFSGGPIIHRMYPPETTETATIIDGTPDEVTAEVFGILTDHVERGNPTVLGRGRLDGMY